ncbi:hypothetical protein NA57DRAFT_58034 [Rhizodiscina lignyota]|uniref:CRT10-domain-containing protein n=1 Tax=Rhizodiscina lignyota TaxID=1504668 RepID=A0A9P4IDQ0_9PEZI|nr:hypothetical protein NA57DRAFT_58034 [Rhizodiscina lignyota]
MSERAFKEIPVAFTSAQPSSERFNSGFLEDNPSFRISKWRANLSALSQVYNLYFICCGSNIQVYEPSFPKQKLSDTPVLILQPEPSAPNLSGYIDRHNSHSITRLLVDFLGSEEIVLVTCDDGDVIGYRTAAIKRAIERRSQPDCEKSNVGDEVKPFWQKNMGISAWGLSVHREARMIAVSANTRQVTVFAFALVEDVMFLGEAPDWPHKRQYDHTIRLPQVQDNIPSVAFCNTGDDTLGQFLLATDIEGNLHLFDVHNQLLVRTVKCAFCALVNHRCLCDGNSVYRSFPHALWGAIWLDRRSFSKQPDIRTATGSRNLSDEELNKHWILDISRTAGEVRDASLEYIPGQRPTTPRRENNDISDRSSNTSTPQSLPQDNNHIPAIADLALSATFQNPWGDDALGVPVSDDDEDEDDDEEEEDDSDSDPPLRQRLHYLPYMEPSMAPIFAQSPSCPIMQLSLREITLFQPHTMTPDSDGDATPAAQAHPPEVYLRRPLYQHVPSMPARPFFNSDSMSHFARLSLTAYIPDIGVVLAGSPEGRVAVLSLTQTQVEVEARLTPFFSMRLDWILPLRSQERSGQRPEQLLLGLAVGPVQGMLGRGGKVRRWRVLLTYEGHNVLAYEIARPRARDGKERASVLVV